MIYMLQKLRVIYKGNVEMVLKIIDNDYKYDLRLCILYCNV